MLLAEDGLECLHLLQTHPEISLIILDLQLPAMDGVATFSEIVKRRPGLPVILTSGYREEDAMSPTVPVTVSAIPMHFV